MVTAPPLNSDLQVVTGLALADLEPLWQLTPTELATALRDVLPATVELWAEASAAVAADWYDELRSAENIDGRFTAIVDDLRNLGAEALAGWGAEPLRLAEPDIEVARYRVEGGLQKRLVNAANRTITTSADEDPKARGYMRRTRAGACRFCLMVASRGGVFTKASSTFACHEHCYCEAVPAWGGRAEPVGPYKRSDRPNNDIERARVKQWIADNL